MPRFDGAGPWGMGPRTGWGIGPCGFRVKGFSGHRFWRPSKKEELEELEEEAKDMGEELTMIKERINELKK